MLGFQNMLVCPFPKYKALLTSLILHPHNSHMRLEVTFFLFNRKLNGGTEKLTCPRSNVKEVKEKRYKLSLDSELSQSRHSLFCSGKLLEGSQLRERVVLWEIVWNREGRMRVGWSFICHFKMSYIFLPDHKQLHIFYFKWHLQRITENNSNWMKCSSRFL